MNTQQENGNCCIQRLKIPFTNKLHLLIRSIGSFDYDKESEEFSKTLPKDAVPIDRKETAHTCILPWSTALQDLPPTEEAASSFACQLELLPPWEKNLFYECIFLQPEAQVWRELCNTQCFVASDGSATQGCGSFAWVLSNTM